jgi:hypothetical protein
LSREQFAQPFDSVCNLKSDQQKGMELITLSAEQGFVASIEILRKLEAQGTAPTAL